MSASSLFGNPPAPRVQASMQKLEYKWFEYHLIPSPGEAWKAQLQLKHVIHYFERLGPQRRLKEWKRKLGRANGPTNLFQAPFPRLTSGNGRRVVFKSQVCWGSSRDSFQWSKLLWALGNQVMVRSQSDCQSKMLIRCRKNTSCSCGLWAVTLILGYKN